MEDSNSGQVMPVIYGPKRVSRRDLLKAGGVLIGAAALAGATSEQASAAGILNLDVACDGRTFAIDPFRVAEGPRRGDTFIINGKIRG